MAPALIHHWLEAGAARHPGRTALATAEATYTYAELADVCWRAAGWLESRGVGRGDRVVVVLPNDPVVLVLVLALSRLGAVFCVLNPAMRSYHLERIVAEVEPALVVTGRQRTDLDGLADLAPVARIEDCWPQMLRAPAIRTPSRAIPTDAAGLVYTSGSTAHPKGVIIGHRQVVFVVEAIQERLRIRPDDVVGCFLPLSFDYGLYQLFLTLDAGATLVLGRERNAGVGLLHLLSSFRVTGLPVVPGMADVLLNLTRRAGTRRPDLRFITNTGDRLPPTVIDELHRLYPGCGVHVMFGVTECKRISILLPEEYPLRPTSVGRPLAGTECLIVRGGRPVPPGEWGELVVRGPHVMLGYWRSPELTRSRFRRHAGTTECAFHTGDVCSMDEEGFLYFHGRRDGIYKQHGHRVSVIEVETAARAIDGVREAVVLRGGGEARLVVAGDIGRERLRAELLERLESYKVPAVLAFVDDVPRSLHGKVDRRALSRMLPAGGDGG